MNPTATFSNAVSKEVKTSDRASKYILDQRQIQNKTREIFRGRIEYLLTWAEEISDKLTDELLKELG